MASFNVYKRIVERAIDDSSDLGSRVSAEVDAAVMAATPREAAKHAKRAVRILQKNGRYSAAATPAIQGMADKYQEVCDENVDLNQENSTLRGEKSGLLRRIFNWKMTAGALGLAATVFGIAYIAKPTTAYSAPTPAPIVRSAEEAKPALPVAVENKDLYSIETLANGAQQLKVLGLDYEANFPIPDGSKDTLVSYINKAESYAAKNGKIGTRVHFHPAELESTLKELYSQGAKSNYGATDKLVKQDIEAAAKELGE